MHLWIKQTDCSSDSFLVCTCDQEEHESVVDDDQSYIMRSLIGENQRDRKHRKRVVTKVSQGSERTGYFERLTVLTTV